MLHPFHPSHIIPVRNGSTPMEHEQETRGITTRIFASRLFLSGLQNGSLHGRADTCLRWQQKVKYKTRQISSKPHACEKHRTAAAPSRLSSVPSATPRSSRLLATPPLILPVPPRARPPRLPLLSRKAQARPRLVDATSMIRAHALA